MNLGIGDGAFRNPACLEFHSEGILDWVEVYLGRRSEDDVQPVLVGEEVERLGMRAGSGR